MWIFAEFFSDEHPSLSFFNDIAKQYDARYSSKDWDNILPMHTEGVYLIPGANPPAKGKEGKLYLM